MIEVQGVSRRFAGSVGTVDALANVDLTVGPGEFVTLIGPSGCGKTTLLRIIAGLDRPDSGSVAVAGHSPADAQRAKQIAFAPQAPALLPWKSVRENARLLTAVNAGANRSRVATDDDIDSLLDQVGLAEFADALPRELSGGMQQRVGLVRAFALHAPVMLMDEPFAALDEMVRADMRYLLLSLWERNRSSVVFVTHSIAEAVALSDRVAVMSARPGRIVHVHDVGLDRPRTAGQEDDPTFLAEVRPIRATLNDRARS